MLDELHVKNVALIRDAVFMPSTGLTVVTGETGSGKTALLSALKLLVGERADSATVREGEAAAVVEGRFFLSGDDGQDGRVASRKISADGRSRVSIDGSMATVKQLAAQLGSTVDLCGQHEHQHLLKSANHMKMLDAWAGPNLAEAKHAYEKAFDDVAAARAALDEIMEASRASAAQVDEARFVLQRIEEVSPSLDEYEEIMRELPRVENAEALAQASDAAYWGLSCDGGAIDAVNAALNGLESLVSADSSLESMTRSLADASYILEDVARDLRAYRDSIDHDPSSFARLQERVSALQGLKRSYGPRMEDVLERRDQAARLVSSVDDAAEITAAAEARLEAAELALAGAACVLEGLRCEVAPRFAEQVNAQMARLEMGSAELVCSVESLGREQWTRSGSSKVEFLYRAGSGMTPRPLARIASGGEVSRVMLACKVVLGAADERSTLVFDEVDAGVGGSVAVALAAVLEDLAKTHQVIVVTHLPQVAVRGDAHYVVRKHVAKDAAPETELIGLQGDDRIAEIARMLSGDGSEASMVHAREMIESVRDSQ